MKPEAERFSLFLVPTSSLRKLAGVQNKLNERGGGCFGNYSHVKPVVPYYSFTKFNESKPGTNHVLLCFVFLFAVSDRRVVCDAQLIEVLA